MNSEENKDSVVIVGGGPAGLTAAYELVKLGRKSIVLEASDQVGGISKTVNYRGYRFDIGGHRFFSKVPYVNQLWNEMLGDDFLTCQRLSRIHYKGIFFDYPLKPMKALIGLGLKETILIGFSYIKIMLLPSRHEEVNFEQWVVNRFGYRLYSIFFKTYTEKVWGMPCHEISADWAAQRIKNLSLKEAVKSALISSGKKDGQVITSLIEEFSYPRFGPGMMWEHCQKTLEEKSCPVLLNNRVKSLRHNDGRVLDVIVQDESNKEFELSSDQFISSMPLRELILCLNPSPPDKVVQAAKKLRYRDYLTVVLIVDRKDVFPDNWIYIHTPQVKLGRIQNYKNWSQDMVDNTDYTTLGLEYFLWEKDEEWGWSDERLVELGIKECAEIGIINAAEVRDSTVVRMKKAYPVYDHEYSSNLAILEEYIKSFSNLQTIGRNGLHRYNNQDHSMVTGVYAARNINGANHNVWEVNVEKTYHEQDSDDGLSSGDRLTPQRNLSSQSTSSEPAADVIEQLYTRLDPISLGGAVGIVSGLMLYIATIFLIWKGGTVIGPNLSLLDNYLIGYEVTGIGAFVGFVEATIIGFMMGFLVASLRNYCYAIVINSIHKKVSLDENQDFMDKI